MADKQYDIWNDDDGEAEAKKSRGSRRILFFGLVLALVLAVDAGGGLSGRTA